MSSSAARTGRGPRIRVPAPRARPSMGVTGPTPVWVPPSTGGAAAAVPPTVVTSRVVAQTVADAGSISATWNAQGINVGTAERVGFTYNGQTYLYMGNFGSPAVAASDAEFVGGGTGGTLNRRLLVAVSAGATPEAAFNSDAPVVGGYDQLVYRHSGQDYLYLGDGTLPATAADFVGMSSASTAPSTITFPGGHGLPVPLTDVTPFSISNAGNVVLARALPNETHEYIALATPDANTVQVVTGFVEDLPASITPLPATGVMQYLSDATPGALTTTEPAISVPIYSYSGKDRTAAFFGFRPLDTSGGVAPTLEVETVALLPDPTTQESGVIAAVVNDPTPANNGLYLSVGPSAGNAIAWEQQ